MSGRRVPVTAPSFGAEEERLLLETLRSGWVTQGARVAAFEERFAAAVEAREAVAVSSCTAGLFLCLHASGIGPGDEVVVPALTFIATANAVVHAGATPVLADVDPRTYNLDPKAAEAAFSPRTRAVLLVHQLGMPADLPAFEALAAERGVLLLEDSACAVGSRLAGRPIGGSGHTGCFSFHPRKVLVTGEGGMITTADSELAARLRRLRHQGMSVSDLERHRADRVITERYPEIGYNFRMSDLQAAVGLAQLDKLDALVARRRALGARYDAALADVPGLVTPAVPESALPNFQSYIVRLSGADRAARDRVQDAMQRRGVATRRGLMAVHREEPYRHALRAGPLRHSEEADAQTLLLPLYADLSHEDQDYVVEQLREVLAAEPRTRA